MQGEYTWDYAWSLIDVLTNHSFPMHDFHHKEWFIQGLLPLTKIPLSQQVIDSPGIELE